MTNFAHLASGLAVLMGIVGASPAQILSPIDFPQTQQTSINDCSTGIQVPLKGGGTATFQGGQFIHYTDAAFDGIKPNLKLPDLVLPGEKPKTPQKQHQAEFGSPGAYLRARASLAISARTAL